MAATQGMASATRREAVGEVVRGVGDDRGRGVLPRCRPGPRRGWGRCGCRARGRPGSSGTNGAVLVGGVGLDSMAECVGGLRPDDADFVFGSPPAGSRCSRATACGWWSALVRRAPVSNALSAPPRPPVEAQTVPHQGRVRRRTGCQCQTKLRTLVLAH